MITTTVDALVDTLQRIYDDEYDDSELSQLAVQVRLTELLIDGELGAFGGAGAQWTQRSELS